MTEARDWQPSAYLRFASERLQPAVDLLARVPDVTVERICDLGCGTGSAFAMLFARFPKAALEAVDRSHNMLQSSRDLVCSDDDLMTKAVSFCEEDIASWVERRRQAPTEKTLLFSNAALHWLPRHEELFVNLMRCLQPGGVLAVQMPRNWHAPSHALMRRTLKTLRHEAPSSLLDRLSKEPVAEPEDYISMLSEHCSSIALWQTEYLQQLSAEEPENETEYGERSPVFRWVASTALRPVLRQLESSPRTLELFSQRYDAALRATYTERRVAGKQVVTFPFRRLFLIATR